MKVAAAVKSGRQSRQIKTCSKKCWRYRFIRFRKQFLRELNIICSKQKQMEIYRSRMLHSLLRMLYLERSHRCESYRMSHTEWVIPIRSRRRRKREETFVKLQSLKTSFIIGTEFGAGIKLDVRDRGQLQRFQQVFTPSPIWPSYIIKNRLYNNLT